MDEQKKMLELRDILKEIEEKRENGIETGCTLDELDSYLEEILAEQKYMETMQQKRKMATSYANRRQPCAIKNHVYKFMVATIGHAPVDYFSDDYKLSTCIFQVRNLVIKNVEQLRSSDAYF